LFRSKDGPIKPRGALDLSNDDPLYEDVKDEVKRILKEAGKPDDLTVMSLEGTAQGIHDDYSNRFTSYVKAKYGQLKGLKSYSPATFDRELDKWMDEQITDWLASANIRVKEER